MLRDHPKPGRHQCSSRSWHLQSGTLRSQRMSFSTAIIGSSSSQIHDALSGEEVSDTVKITLALQNVRGNLAQSLNVSVRALHSLKFTVFSPTTSIMQPQQRQKASINLTIKTRKRRSTMSRRAKAKVTNRKDLKKGKTQRDPPAQLSEL